MIGDEPVRGPLLVDGDTGYGEVLNVIRPVRELEEAGSAVVQLEDQVLPKEVRASLRQALGEPGGDGQTGLIDRMQTRQKLYAPIGYQDYKALHTEMVRSRLSGESAATA